MSKEILELFDSMKRSIATIGAKKTSNILKEYKKTKDSNRIIINIIIDVVMQDFSGLVSSKNELFKRNIRGDAASARNMILVLVNKCTILTSNQISEHFTNVSGGTVRNVISFYNRLDRKNKFDKLVIDRHEKLLEKVIKFTNK